MEKKSAVNMYRSVKGRKNPEKLYNMTNWTIHHVLLGKILLLYFMVEVATSQGLHKTICSLDLRGWTKMTQTYSPSAGDKFGNITKFVGDLPW